MKSRRTITVKIFYLLLAARLWPVYKHPLVEVVVLHQAVGEAHPVRAHRVASAVIVIRCKHASSALGKQDGNCQNGTTCCHNCLGRRISLLGGHQVLVSPTLHGANCSLVYATDTYAASRVMGSESRARHAQNLRLHAHIRVS